jgi:acetyl-CoA carboxylase biotin carboxyl carrier protein
MTKQVSPDDIEALVSRFHESGYQELHVRFDGFELYLSNDPAADGIYRETRAARAPVSVAQSTSPAPPIHAPASIKPASVAIPDGMVVVRAPYLGTFYRAPTPGATPYVEIGHAVGSDSELCLVEVMKLFTAVRAGIDGTVRQILAQDGAMVELDQPLFVIEPAA